MNFFRKLFGPKEETSVQTIPPGARVTPDAARCVQCGICTYNCPVGIDVRVYAFQGLVVEDPTCIACGNCIERCPRNTLRFVVPGDDLLFQPAWEKGLSEQAEAFDWVGTLIRAGV